MLAALAAGNGVLTTLATAAILAGGRHSRIGVWLARGWERMRSAPEFDALFRRASPFPRAAALAALAGKLMQVGQLFILLFATARRTGLLRALSAEAVHLVGSTFGDLIPAQLGATDGAYTYFAGTLELSTATALAIAMLCHLNQAVWAVIGCVAPIFLFGRGVPSKAVG